MSLAKSGWGWGGGASIESSTAKNDMGAGTKL